MFGTKRARSTTQELEKQASEADEALEAAEKEIAEAVVQRQQARARLAKVGQRLQALAPQGLAVFASHPHGKK